MVNTTERQKEIISAAFSLISGKGIQELTVKRIAEAVGVSEPAIYRHFTSKSEILSAVLGEIIAHRNTVFKIVGRESGKVPAKLGAFFNAQASLLEETPALTIMLFPEDIFRNDSELLVRIAAMMEETLAGFRGLMQDGIAEGTLRQDIDQDAVAVLLIGGFRLLVSRWRLGAVPEGLSAATRVFVDRVLPLIVR
jgi:AcrR family transcriptional regulator